jgi:prepilin-type N-terminal cleavage/methylation domain-containing protein
MIRSLTNTTTQKKQWDYAGFTLVEIFIAIAVIGILALLRYPITSVIDTRPKLLGPLTR